MTLFLPCELHWPSAQKLRKALGIGSEDESKPPREKRRRWSSPSSESSESDSSDSSSGKSKKKKHKKHKKHKHKKHKKSVDFTLLTRFDGCRYRVLWTCRTVCTFSENHSAKVPLFVLASGRIRSPIEMRFVIAL